MARLSRIVVVNVPHHVTQRGNARQFLLTGLPNAGIFATGPGVDYSWLGLLQWAGIISPCGVLCVENWHGPGGLTADYGDAAIVCGGEGSCQNMWWNGSGWDTFENVCFPGTECYLQALSQEVNVETNAANKYILGPVAEMEATGLGVVAAAGVWDALPGEFTDPFNGLDDNPLFRIGKGRYPGGQQRWRWASGGRWGKGGPELPWHWHIPWW